MNTLQVGDKLPPFTVNDQNGNTISDTDYANQKLVVFFYPKANTPGCTAEACDLREKVRCMLSKMMMARANVV
ncbi:MAG: redoxin domain-containing protein, partial [Flavobacteriaceae bacterium]